MAERGANGASRTLLALYWFGIMAVGLAVIGWGAADGTGELSCLVANLGLFVVFAYAVCVLDVVAISLVARALSDRWVAIEIGSGPAIASFKVGRLRTVSLRAIPAISATVVATTRAHGQQRRLGIAMAASGAVLLGVAALLGSSPGSWHGFRASLVNETAPASVALAALVPYGVVLVVSSVTGRYSKPQLEASRALGHVLVIYPLLLRGEHEQAERAARVASEALPGNELADAMLLQALCANEREEAFALATGLLERATTPAVRATALNSWAWHVYVHQLGDHAVTADERTREAVELLPTSESILDTRGHVLVWLGRLDEARPLLERAHALAEGAASRASASIGLALLHARRGEMGDAQRWLDAARQEGVHHRLLARAVAIIEPLRRTPDGA